MFTSDNLVLVTGASSGIGEAIALLCVKRGATVLACGRNLQKLEYLQKHCSAPDRWICISRDLLMDMQDLPDWVKNLSNEYGRLWGLAHCAGAGAMDALRTYELNMSHSLFDLNFNVPILLAKGFGSRLVHEKGGSMLFIASAAGVFPEKGHLLYGATKAALIAAIKSISLEVARYELRANCLSPGIVDTPMQKAAEDFMGESYRKAQLEQYPFGFGKPEDIAELAVFLLSKCSSWITGQNYVLSGGRY